MLDLGWTEILVIAIVLIVVVGPKDLPKMLRAFGRTTSKMRSMAGEFRKQFDDAIKEAELDEVRDLAREARKLNPASEIKKALSPMELAARDVRAGLDKAMKPTPAGTKQEPSNAEAVLSNSASKEGPEPKPEIAAATPPATKPKKAAPVAKAPAKPAAARKRPTPAKPVGGLTGSKASDKTPT